MLDIPVKSPGDQAFSDEYNSMAGEIENTVTSTGQTLNGGDLYQLSKAITNQVGAADFYEDTGIANSYVLTVINPMPEPTEYLPGMRVRFQVGNNNTGPSTVNVAGLGVKPIKKQNNSSDLEQNDLVAGRFAEMTYLANDDVFELIVLHESNIQSDTIRAAGQGYLPFGMGAEWVTNVSFNTNPGNVKAQNDDTVQIFIPSTITKIINASWVEGDNQGGLAAGLIIQPNTNYYAFATSKANGDSDIIIDNNPNATNILADANWLGAGYINYAECWRYRTNSSSQLTQFVRFNNEYYFSALQYIGFFTNNRPFAINTLAPPKTNGFFISSFGQSNSRGALLVSDLALTVGSASNFTSDTDSDMRRETIPTNSGNIFVRQGFGSAAGGFEMNLWQRGYEYLGPFI